MGHTIGFPNDFRICTTSIPQIWDDVLAEMAQDWAELCQWKHGNVDNDYEHEFLETGQNLFFGTGMCTFV